MVSGPYLAASDTRGLQRVEGGTESEAPESFRAVKRDVLVRSLSDSGRGRYGSPKFSVDLAALSIFTCLPCVRTRTEGSCLFCFFVFVFCDRVSK